MIAGSNQDTFTVGGIGTREVGEGEGRGDEEGSEGEGREGEGGFHEEERKEKID